ncbi:hypothetical protein E2C01_007579 [Portunus trituberculatus]|uniref:Uncharacterized protein n=1 Tax=Portunus trituberculatus TaxID=210409 RepID=A0A5B7CYI9_PORTR|nr:hypothetical protein [Portunus trituberculatus]
MTGAHHIAVAHQRPRHSWQWRSLSRQVYRNPTLATPGTTLPSPEPRAPCRVGGEGRRGQLLLGSEGEQSE